MTRQEISVQVTSEVVTHMVVLQLLLKSIFRKKFTELQEKKLLLTVVPVQIT